MKKILVIDDSKMTTTFLRLCLEKAGYLVDVWLPSSALEVPEHLKESRPDLIITDYFMPGLSGAAVARIACQSNPRIPVIVLTAMREPEVIHRLKNLLVTTVLSKPIEADTLVSCIEAALAT
jgi:CheY-like chemotaxis protein